MKMEILRFEVEERELGDIPVPPQSHPRKSNWNLSQIEQKNEVNINLILTSFFCSIWEDLNRFALGSLRWNGYILLPPERPHEDWFKAPGLNLFLKGLYWINTTSFKNNSIAGAFNSVLMGPFRWKEYIKRSMFGFSQGYIHENIGFYPAILSHFDLNFYCNLANRNFIANYLSH